MHVHYLFTTVTLALAISANAADTPVYAVTGPTTIATALPEPFYTNATSAIVAATITSEADEASATSLITTVSTGLRTEAFISGSLATTYTNSITSTVTLTRTRTTTVTKPGSGTTVTTSLAEGTSSATIEAANGELSNNDDSGSNADCPAVTVTKTQAPLTVTETQAPVTIYITKTRDAMLHAGTVSAASPVYPTGSSNMNSIAGPSGFRTRSVHSRMSTTTLMITSFVRI